jgi:protein-disulfide isomerase
MGDRFLKKKTGKLRSGPGSIQVYQVGRASVPVAIFAVFSAFLILTSTGCSRPSSDSNKPLVPYFGEGPCEVIIFTDYFCPPCQAFESELDLLLGELMVKGVAKITFVDAPANKLTSLYGKYLLYAANESNDFWEVQRARKALFSIAGTNVVSTEESLASELKAQGVAFKSYDLSKVVPALNEILKSHDIRSTPACVVKYSGTDIRKYTGPEEIKRGLLLLLSSPKPPK